METTSDVKTKYADYLLPILCFVTGILIGIWLSPIKNGRIAVFSNNTIGSNNDCASNANDGMDSKRINKKRELVRWERSNL